MDNAPPQHFKHAPLSDGFENAQHFKHAPKPKRKYIKKSIKPIKQILPKTVVENRTFVVKFTF